MGYFWGRGRGQKLFGGLHIKTKNFCFQSIALFLLYYVLLSLYGGVGGGSQRLLSSNPTTVLIVLLLGLRLLLGCDNDNKLPKIVGKG